MCNKAETSGGQPLQGMACNFFSYCDLCWEDMHHQWVSCCQEACFSYLGGKLNSFYPSNSDVFRMFFMSSIFHGGLGSLSRVRLEKREVEYLFASFQQWWSTIWWPCSKTVNHHQQQFWPRKLIIVPVKSDFKTTKNMGLQKYMFQRVSADELAVNAKRKIVDICRHSFIIDFLFV